MEVTSQGMDLWFLVLLAISVSTIRVNSQLDPGFINIDCGRAANSTFYDSNTELTFVSDDQFIDTGENHRIATKYATDLLLEEFLTVRSFPYGTRNCYTLRSLNVGSKYLIKAIFMYGNYDEKNKLPNFDVHLGVNYWDTVKITSADGTFSTEIITAATSDYLQVCLFNKDLGTPFISVIHLKQLETSMYKDYVSYAQSLVRSDRRNLGASSQLRYPADPYDRIWRPYMEQTWTIISTSSTVDPDTDFAIPSLVMQTAATTLNSNQSLDLSWTADSKSTKFYVILHFCEIEDLPSSAHREFAILANGDFVFNYLPDKLSTGWASYTIKGSNKYSVSLKATSNSNLPPLLNAFELYVITPSIWIPTNSDDVAAMNTIKANYKVNKDWTGDPCAPIELSWSGVTCDSVSITSLCDCVYDTINTLMNNITSLNLSSSGLTGAIVSSFGNLSALQSLDLSDNDLSGDLPTFLDKLSDLTYLDITGNDKILTTLPPGLQSKKQDGNLIFKFGQRQQQKSPVNIIQVARVLIGLLLIAVFITIVVCLRRCKSKQLNTPKSNVSPVGTPSVYMGTLPDGTRFVVTST